MSLLQTNTSPPFNITRLSHVVLTSKDLDRTRFFYETGLGLEVTFQDNNYLCLRALEETSHHSLIFERSDVSKCQRIGYRVFEQDELAKATNDIARGEIIQLELSEKKESIKLNELLKVSYLKTGRLFEASAKTGAMLAEKSSEEIKSFGLLGRSLGTAFQIQDDILDYAALKFDTGKPAFKDFKEGKITFPLYFAIQNADSKERKFLLGKLATAMYQSCLLYTSPSPRDRG